MREITFPTAADDLFAVVGGSGSLIVFMHGALGTHQQVLPVMESFADRYTIATPDVRGRGRSACPHPEHHTWDRYAADVVDLMDHLGAESAVVGGASFGAAAAVAVAIRHPDRVSALALVGPAFRGQALGWAPTQETALASMAGMARSIEEIGLQETLERTGAALGEPFASAMKERWSQHDPDSAVASIRALTGPQPFGEPEELAKISVPTIVVPGSDGLHPREAAELYASRIQGATFADVNVAGDAPTPDQVVETLVPVLQSFFESLS